MSLRRAPIRVFIASTPTPFSRARRSTRESPVCGATKWKRARIFSKKLASSAKL